MDNKTLINGDKQAKQDISPIEQEYLAGITQLLQEQDTVRIIDVANMLGHDRSKAHYWVKKLCDRSTVEMVPKKGIITLAK